MKKTFTIWCLVLFVAVLSSSSILKDQNGRFGNTGAPGELTCGAGGCHSGGSSASKSVTLAATPTFSLDQYYPDSVYTVSVTVNATGFSKFGFGCEILDLSNAKAGFIQAVGSGVRLINGSKNNVTHNTPKSGSNSATFTFTWVAPSAGTGDVKFYACGNAVNGTGTVAGDLPIPFSYAISEGTPPAPTTTTGIGEIARSPVSNLSVYPNPASDFSTLTFYLDQTRNITLELVEISGKQAKVLSSKLQYTGNHSEIIDLRGVANGVYFLRASSGGEKLSQKLIVVAR